MTLQPPPEMMELCLDVGEVPYSCSICFLSDFQNLNCVVSCDICQTSVHMRCAGVGEDARWEHGYTCPICTVLKNFRRGHDWGVQLTGITCVICGVREGMVVHSKDR
jgi:transcription elongation factor Elf1